MATRTALLDAARRAVEVLRDSNARARIYEGYTRIDPVKIAQWAGVAVMFQPLEKLLGAFINEGRPGIIVNIARTPGMVHVTCAHELGHYFLSHSPTADLEIDYGGSAASFEQEADQFAYSLLAPQWLIVRIMQRKGWHLTSLTDPAVVYQLSLRLGTSYTSTVWTLMRLKLLSPPAAKNLAGVPPKKLKRELTGTSASPDGFADVWLLDESDRDAILEPHAKDAFVVELNTNSSAGYMWSLDDIRSEGFSVEPVTNDVHENPVVLHFGDEAPVGADSSLRFVVSRPDEKPIEYGARTSFAMLERRPWLPPAAEDQRCQFAAEYERLAVGVDRAEQMRRLEEAKTSA